VESMGLVCGIGSSLHVPMSLHRFNREVMSGVQKIDLLFWGRSKRVTKF
jgi:hypothetical protein